jgi:hypothetical protein
MATTLVICEPALASSIRWPEGLSRRRSGANVDFRRDNSRTFWTTNLKPVARTGVERPTGCRTCVVDNEIDYERSRMCVVTQGRSQCSL